MTERQRQNIRYWTEFCEHLRQRGSQLESRISKARHFIDFRIDTGCFLRAGQVVKSKYGPTSITVGLILKGRAKAYFDVLKEQQPEIDKEFGKKLQWWAEWDTEKHVALRKDADPSDESDWPHQHQWMAIQLEKLNEVFRPRIKELRSLIFK